jgi:hypothetical protein
VDKQNSTKDKVAPIKITRSVGLQVSCDLLLSYLYSLRPK